MTTHLHLAMPVTNLWNFMAFLCPLLLGDVCAKGQSSGAESELSIQRHTFWDRLLPFSSAQPCPLSAATVSVQHHLLELYSCSSATVRPLLKVGPRRLSKTKLMLLYGRATYHVWQVITVTQDLLTRSPPACALRGFKTTVQL